MNRGDREGFNLLSGNDLDKEMQEISDFFDKVTFVKSKILQDKENSEFNNQNNLNDEQILLLLNKNVNLFKVITEDTIKIYIDSFFEKESDNTGLFKFTEDALENFLTSILIFAQD